MKRQLISIRFLLLLGLMLIGAAAVSYSVSRIAAQDVEGDAIRGGLLYDKWWAVLGEESPSEDQPLWATQDTNTRSGADTWRCKECHGWDYKGVDGAYSSGSHYTGFPGVIDVSGQPIEEIVNVLNGSANADHDFSSVMDDQALIDLAVFLSETLIDTDTIVNEDKSVMGDADTGEPIFANTCAVCHGPDGTAINFGSEQEPVYVGTLVNDNPWEVLHKVRYGQPGTPMPAAVGLGLSNEEVANLLAFTQTLPTSPAISGGGLLYDKWWVVLEVDAPEEDQPLWATQDTNTRSGADTWRCKECHGWDYQGADGAYSTGSHFTGFPGVLASASMSSDELMAWLDGEVNADHNFTTVMDDAALEALVAFIQREIVDVTPYINDDKTVNGDVESGETLFASTCAVCHGADGTVLNFGSEDEPIYVGTLANDNPWETFHKISFGQPGTSMPSALALGWTHEEIANVLAYIQSLPAE